MEPVPTASSMMMNGSSTTMLSATTSSSSAAVASGIRAASVDAAMESQSDSKLKYIIMFGAPLVAGVALYWFLNRRNSKGAASKKTAADAKPNAVKQSAQEKIDDQINSADPNEKATGYKNRGNHLFKVKNYKEAIECYSDAIRVCPLSQSEMLSTFYQNRAAAYENLGMFDNVIQDCGKAIEFNRRYSKAYFRRAKAWEQRGELRKCLEDATCCSILEQFQHQNALQLADKVLKTFGAQAAKEAFDNRRPQLPSSSFIRNFFRSFVEDPVVLDLNAKRNNTAPPPSAGDQQPPSSAQGGGGAPTGYDHALQALIEEKWESVLTHCGEEIDRNQHQEKVDKALILRAGFLIMSGRVDDALADLDKLFAREHVDVKVRVNALIKKATAEVHREQAQQALATFEKAVELDPNNADIYLHRGQVFLLMDQMDQTLKNLELSASLRPDFISAAAQLAYTQYRCGTRFGDRVQQDAAMKKFDVCIQKFPDAPEVYFLYAQLMMELQKYDFAEKYLNKFVEKDPLDSAGLVHLGLLALQARQDVENAVTLMQKAIELEPKCQFAYETLGTLMMQTGRMTEGIALLDKAVALAQTEGEIAHLIALKTSAEIQMTAVERFGIDMQAMPPGMAP